MSLLDHTPPTSAADAERIARDVFGVAAAACELPSERDRNFRLDAEDGTTWVLKVSNALEQREVLEAQAQAAALAAAAGVPVQAPRSARSEEEIPLVDGHLVRLMQHLPGVLLADVEAPSQRLRRDLGAVLGRLAR